MARVQNTLIGRASGSVGEVVFLTWRLINVTRSKPVSVANPDTILQRQQRNRFGATVELYRILKDVLTIGLKNRNRKMTLFNFFQRLNQQNCFQNVGDGTVAFLPENLKISYGLMNVTPFVVIQPSGSTQIEVSYSSFITSNNQSLNDRPILVAFNEDKGIFHSNILIINNRLDGETQTTGNLEIQQGNVIHAWLFFVNGTTGYISDTVYNSIVVA